MGIQEKDLNLAVIPLGHSYGLGNLVLPLLAQGTPLLCCASPLPQALAADCARWRPTVFPAVPTLLRALVRAEVEPAALASLRLVISAGALLAPEIATAFAGRFGRAIHSFYGSSETGGITYDRHGDAALTGRSVGTPMDGVRLHFRAGGRFTVESAAVMGPGRFSPPDRATLTPEGGLVLLGRVGRAVKIAGRRLDLGEVERALLAVHGVRGACAFAHPEYPDALAAVVATDLSPAALRTALAATMAAWKIPERLVAVGELPVTARGKPDRAALRALVRGR
jgi:acyl-coenzyme A synthetase/AMP-(fatty) acid ligase